MGKVAVPIDQLTDAEIDRIVVDLEQRGVAGRTLRGMRRHLEHAKELRQFKSFTQMADGRRVPTDEAPESLRRFLSALPQEPAPRGAGA